MLVSPRIQNNQVKTLLELLVSVIPTKDGFIQELTEVISEIRQPLRTVATEIPEREKMERNLKVNNLIKTNLTLNNFEVCCTLTAIESH